MENTQTPANRGYKVMNPDMTCRGFQFEIGKTYKHEGAITMCGAGFHFCLNANDCFNYYSFDSRNRVFEIEHGETVEHGSDKSVTSEITIIREISWQEALTLINTGKDNTGRGNSGDRNSGDRNSGDSNSGYRNSGDRNSGYRNSGDRNSGNWNSGDSNSGDRNSGNWNSGYRNSGDSNSGYRNSGAFCTDPNPKLVLFDKKTDILVKDWENSEVVKLMYSIDPNIWVPMHIMSDEEKKNNPGWETTGGYLKRISMHDAWKNFWDNLREDKKQLFLDLPNFDAKKFKEITGIDVKPKKK